MSKIGCTSTKFKFRISLQGIFNTKFITNAESYVGYIFDDLEEVELRPNKPAETISFYALGEIWVEAEEYDKADEKMREVVNTYVSKVESLMVLGYEIGEVE